MKYAFHRDAVESVIELIVEQPSRWREIDEGIRRCFTHVFPHPHISCLPTLLSIAILTPLLERQAAHTEVGHG
jgi:hypothetical protein